MVVLPLLAGCGNGVDESMCRDAATRQAEAEFAWTDALEAHSAVHQTGEEHPDAEDQSMATRIDLIVATAETRRMCG